MRCLGYLLALLVLLMGGGLAAVGRAEVRHMEVVGALPLHPEARSGRAAKDAAISQALWEGVSRVGRDLLAEGVMPEPGPETQDGAAEADAQGDAVASNPSEETGGQAVGEAGRKDEDPLRDALGRDMLPFTRGFRIVEDRGESPTLFSDDPNAATEYVVVVDVQVDVDRVRKRLIRAGLLLPAEPESALRGVPVELRGVTTYAAYRRMLDLFLEDAVGAKNVLPLEFERGRALVRVESEASADALLERILVASQAVAGLSLRPESELVATTGTAALVLRVHYEPRLAEEPASQIGADRAARGE